MEDKKIMELVSQFHTPMYLFDGDKIEENYKNMKHLLPEMVEIFYSVKANPNIGICKILQSNNSGIEVASSGELYLALKAGYSPENILFTGPGKTMEELQYAADSNILSINIESFQELELLNEIGKERDKVLPVGIRIHPNLKRVSKNPVLSMMGKGTQFGVDVDQLPELFHYIKESKYLNLVCFHVYAGSQIFEAETAADYFEQTFEMFKNLITEYDLSVRVLDFGGGFGVSYDGKKEKYDFQYFANSVWHVIDKHIDFVKGKRLIFESGRYLLSEGGVFLTEVQYRKKLHDNTFLITDGGMNHYALATFREKKIRGNFQMKILDNQNEEEVVSVAGPLCTPDDILGRNVTLNKADRGDILCIEHAGAYGSAFSPLGFLGHPSPCELLSYKGHIHCLKPHGHIGDIVKDQPIINL